MKLVFTGIQGCGKWTQARILVEKYGYTLVEMWAEFRKTVSSEQSKEKKIRFKTRINIGLYAEIF